MILVRDDATTTVVLRSVETDPVGLRMLPRGPRQSSRRFSRIGKAVGAFIVLVVAVLGMLFSGGLPGTPPAQAVFDNVLGICKDPGEYVPNPQPWPGVVGGLALVGRDLADSASPVGGGGAAGGLADFAGGLPKYFTPYTNADSPTAYEWWGTAGLTWDVQNYEDLGGDCGIGAIGAVAGNLIATMVFQFGLVIGEIGLTVYGWALNVDAIGPFLNSIGEVLSSLRDALFLEYLIPIVMFGALWMMWVGLVKRRTSEAVQGAVWMVFASAATLFFLTNPVWVTETLNKAVTTVSTTIVDGTLSATSGISGSDICKAGGSTNSPFTQASWRTSQCQIWEVYMFSPWAAGVFGTVAGQNIDVSTEGDQDVGVRIPGKDASYRMPLVYLDSQAFNKNEVLEFEALQNFANITDSAAMQKKKAQWTAVYDTIATGPAFPARDSFTGLDWGGRLSIAFVNIVAMFAGAIPILFLAFTLVLMQLGTVFLLLAAPLFLTLGIHPGFGRRIAISWVEMLLSLQVKRIGTAVLLALLLAVFQAVLRSTDSWIAQVMLVGAASLGLLVYRKRILDQLSRIQLGGGGGNSLAQGGAQAGKRAMGTATGAATSGVSAAATGAGGTGGRAGSFLVGAALGSMMGRGGNPLTAARMGSARGAAVGRRRTRKAASEVDSTSPEGIAAEQRRAERDLRVDDSTMDTMERSNLTTEKLADAWQKKSQENGNKPVPVPLTNEALREELERRGVPMRDRVGGAADPRVQRAAERIADAANENAASVERQTDKVVEVHRESTREVNTTTQTVDAEKPVRPSAAGGDPAAAAVERARRANAARQRAGREARERAAGSDGSTPQRPIPRAPDSAAPRPEIPRPPSIPDSGDA